ncbi:MAG: hypothetical protein IKW13_03010 [Thermoguttaceae bacterium]|nr:hypothetical protein [Thermoguttaceae bacterium]MBR5243183.1 hypothetical protein [Thermoguttaceae bacterium]
MMGLPISFVVAAVLMGIAGLAFWHKMKIWSVSIQGFNLLFATLFAIGLFEFVANQLDNAWSTGAYYNDMLAFLAVFVPVLAILMFVTSRITRADLWFSKKTDSIAKWVALFVIFGSFCGTGVFVFFQTMPEKPRQTSAPFTMKIVDFMSKGSLKPLIGSSTFDTTSFVQGQHKRNTEVHDQVVNDEGNWKYGE